MVLVRRWGVLALVAVMGVGLVGCSGGDGDKQPGTARSSTAEPAAESTPGESVLPGAEQVPVAPGAMAKGDADGAEAFVRHYFALVNYAQRTGDLEPLRVVSGAGCVACQGGLDWLEKAARKEWLVKGGEHRLSGISVSPAAASKGSFVTEFVLRTDGQKVLSSRGRLVESYAAGTAQLRLTARFLSGGSWIVKSWETL